MVTRPVLSEVATTLDPCRRDTDQWPRCPVCLRAVALLVEGSDVCIVCDGRLHPDPPVFMSTTTSRRVVVGHAA